MPNVSPCRGVGAPSPLAEHVPGAHPRMCTSCALRSQRIASPWVLRASAGALPGHVYASVRTDTRTHVVRESLAAILRRTMPKG